MIKLNRDHTKMNEAVQGEIKNLFEGRTVEGKYKTLRYSNVRSDKLDDSYVKLTRKINSKGTASQKYRADVDVIDNATGKVVDTQKGMFLGNVPTYTKKGGFLIEGSTYSLPNQIRLKPGAYTLHKESGDVETMMNVQGGRTMKVISPQNKDDVDIHIGSRKFNPIDMAKILGASDSEITKTLGKDTADHLSKKSNLEHTALNLSQALGLTGPDITPPYQEVQKTLQEYFGKTVLDPASTNVTLGKRISTVNKDAILRSVKKVIGVKKGDVPEDDRENLMFKRIIPPEKLLSEGVTKELRMGEGRMKAVLNNPFGVKVLDVIKEPTLTKASTRFMTTAAISRMPEEYNPLQMIQGASDITPVGEGGISSTEMITPSVRSLHNSQLGFIDPIKSPEGANTGVTLSVTHGAHIDDEGNPALKVKNTKTGKTEFKTVADLWEKNLAFPDDEGGIVGMRRGDKIIEGKLKDSDYQIRSSEDMYGPAMNSLGVISSNDATRNLMASKHVLQALPIENPDTSPVQLEGRHGPLLGELAKKHLPTSPAAGVVTKVDAKNGLIHLKAKNGEVKTVDYAVNPMQLNTKTFIKHTPSVKVGDKVAEGDHLADSNFTKDGQFAIGKNLRSAWMMYPGTRNDAFVVSETGAKKMTSLHSSKFDVDQNNGTILDKKKFVSLFPEIAKKIDIQKYDDRGILLKGQTVSKDEPLTLGVRKMDTAEVRFENEKVKKMTYGGFTPDLQVWKGDNQGTVTSIETRGNKHRVIAEYKSILKAGDKLSGRSGNKGVVSMVIKDKDMPQDESGSPLDVIFGGAGVVSRQNPAQLIEAGLSEVAKKTGKKYTLPHYSSTDMGKFTEDEAKKNNVQLYHKIYDPVRKIHLKNKVFVADYNTMKLFKQGEGTYSAIGRGPVDSLDQPRKGGKLSASSISNMEINSLLAHDAKDFLSEVGSIKSQKNKKWFEAFEGGGATPPPEKKTANIKFKGLLNQMGIDLQEKGSNRNLIPLSDRDVLKQSAGEVTEAFGLKRNTMTPVKSGFYDTKIFGGNGNQYGHIDLGTKVINPFYKKNVASILGMSEKQLDKQDPATVYGQVLKVKTSPKIKQIMSDIKKTKDTGKVDRSMKTIKALRKIDELGKSPADVMFMSKIPVLPIGMRPPTPLPNGSIVEHDVNVHYKNITRAAKQLNKAKKADAPTEIVSGLQNELQQHVGAMYGTNRSPDPKTVRNEVKSVMDIVGGDTPKTSFWHQKILKNKVFGSGRAVIVPHNKSLGMDEIEIPKEVAWGAFEPHVTRKMSQMGIAPADSKSMIEARNPTATNVLTGVMKDIPVVINRSPSLHKHNMTGHYAKIGGGNVMSIPGEIENGQNADDDGDQLGIHVPFGHKAVDDVKTKLMASKQLLGSASKGNLVMGIDLDPFIGFFDATKSK